MKKAKHLLLFICGAAFLQGCAHQPPPARVEARPESSVVRTTTENTTRTVESTPIIGEKQRAPLAPPN